MARQILIVDPDSAIRREIIAKLEMHQIRALEADTGREGLKCVQEHQPELVLTELVLPDITGLSLCRQLREGSGTEGISVVIMSAYADEMDRVISFEQGVDDFVAKPFSANELAARVRAILRRPPVSASRNAEGEAVASRTPGAEQPLTIGGKLVDATPREIQILAELVRHEGRVLSREELLRRVWSPEGTATPRTVDAHIKSLRRKLGEERDAIRTVRGVGYSYERRST